MRNRTVKSVVFLSVVATIGVVLILFTKKTDRSPAALPSKIETPRPSGKHLSALKIDIANRSMIPDQGDSEVHLQGRIYINNSRNQKLSYRWHLPTEIESVGGQISVENIDVTTGELLTVEIRVRGFNRQTQKTISLQAWTQSGREKLGSSAVIVSRPEDTYEAKAFKAREEVDLFHQRKSKSPRRF